jgi:hypothetical protein
MLVSKESYATADVAKALKSFGEDLLKKSNGEGGEDIWRIPGAKAPAIKVWNNPENIESGTCGAILVLLDLYEVTHDEAFLVSAQHNLEKVISFCKRNPSPNYALYTGRAGVVLIMMRLYEICGDESLLTKATGIIKDAGNEYLHATYVNDSLYEGRSGTLLALLLLYKATRKEPVLNLIRQFAIKIAGNMEINGAGVSWKRDEYLLAPQSCFAFGTAGIGYVFMQLHTTFNDNFSLKLAQECLRFTQRHVEQEIQGYMDKPGDGEATGEIVSKRLSWSKGIAGMGILNMVFHGLKNNYSEPFSTAQEVLTNAFQKMAITPGLNDGSAGIGMSLLLYDQVKPDEQLKETMAAYVSILSRNLTADLEGGLFDGALAQAYVCLQCVKPPGRYFNVLCPGWEPMEDQRLEPPTVQLNLGNPFELYNIVLSKPFHRTVGLLSSIHPEAYQDFLKKLHHHKSIVEQLSDYLGSDELRSRVSPLQQACVDDLFPLELAKFDMLESSRVQPNTEEALARYKTINSTFNRDEWFSQYNIGITDNIKIIKTKWDWTSRYLLKPEDFKADDYIGSPAGNFSTMIFVSMDGRVLERPVSIIGSILEVFKTPRSAREAVQEVRNYFVSIADENHKKDLILATGSIDFADFLSRSEYLLKHNIQQMIFDNVLSLSEK